MPMHELDITKDTCPMTFVRTRLALDRMPSGSALRVRLAGSEPWRNVVGNARSLGHELVSDEADPDAPQSGVRLIVIRKR